MKKNLRIVVPKSTVRKPNISDLSVDLMDIDLPVLHTLVREGKIDQILAILNDDNINSRDAHGFTPLHHAAMQGDKDMAELLIAMGADITAINNQGLTPAQLANFFRQNAILELFASDSQSAPTEPLSPPPRIKKDRLGFFQ